MATAAELKEQLRAKMTNSAFTESTQPQQDRFIKGTLIDDRAIAFFQKLATIIFIVAIIGLLWLWLERSVGTRVISPYRAWVPSIYIVVMMFWIKPFLNLGWLGWGFVVVQSINLSGYLFQAIQAATGVR
jgi:hypothetical protein